MATTTNYSWEIPDPFSATYQDLWGYTLNTLFGNMDSQFALRTLDMNFADYVLSRPVFKDYGEKVNSIGNITGAVTVDLSLGNHYEATLTGNVTFTFTNYSPTGNAMPIILYLKQDGTGGRTVTFPASWVWANGSAPSFTTTAGRTDEIVGITRNGGTSVSGSVRGLNYNI